VRKQHPAQNARLKTKATTETAKVLMDLEGTGRGWNTEHHSMVKKIQVEDSQYTYFVFCVCITCRGEGNNASSNKFGTKRRMDESEIDAPWMFTVLLQLLVVVVVVVDDALAPEVEHLPPNYRHRHVDK
jgi:hypothetical protein